MSEIDYRYNEDEILIQVADYINGTYSQHYATNQIEASEFIMDAGHGEGFFIGNILKYAQRYGKKGTHKDARKDLMKVIHYAVMAIYNHDNLDIEERKHDIKKIVDDFMNRPVDLDLKNRNDELVYGKYRVNYDDDYPNY